MEAFTDECPPTPELLKVVGITTVGKHFRSMTYEFLTNRREHCHFGFNVRLKLGKIDSKFFLNLFVYIKNFFCGTLLFALRTVTLIFFVCVVMEAIIKLYFI